jgi:hypothetical protein
MGGSGPAISLSSDNWDKQAVLLTLDPKLAPAPAAQ